MKTPITLLASLLGLTAVGLAIASIYVSSDTTDMHQLYDKQQSTLAQAANYRGHRIVLLRTLSSLTVARKDRDAQAMLAGLGVKMRFADPGNEDKQDESQPAAKPVRRR